MYTLLHLCELERTQLLTIFAMSVQNPQLAGYLSILNPSKFAYVEGFNARLFDCTQFASPLYEADNCIGSMPKNHQHTVMYIDPKTRQTFINPTTISCKKNH